MESPSKRRKLKYVSTEVEVDVHRFLTSLLPNSFDAQKKTCLFRLIRPYVITAISEEASSVSIKDEVLRPQVIRDPWISGDGKGWPRNRLPVELFHIIVSYLNRKDIESLRMVSKEFEDKVSSNLFRTVVVPFRQEMYGMLDDSDEGAQRAMTIFGVSGSGPNESNLGMQVFRGFGHQVKRFGMSFEIEEGVLASPPRKAKQDKIVSYWGRYKWPFQEYSRYHHCVGLERTADETHKMTEAFSNLIDVTDLALSMTNGLGWLHGPDHRGDPLKPAVFSSQPYATNSSSKSSTTLSQNTLTSLTRDDFSVSQQSGNDAEAGPANPHLDPSGANHFQLFYMRSVGGVPDDAFVAQMRLVSGKMRESSSTAPLTKIPADQDYLVPNHLTSDQNEWLLEIGWAQDAFLSSYIIAVMDNGAAFVNLQTFTIARLPGRYLTKFRRPDFWEALPKLHDLTIYVVPDWREICKTGHNIIFEKEVIPSSAAEVFYDLLKQSIAPLKGLRKLAIGWAAGGEIAQGIYSRNLHIMSAPICNHSRGMLSRMGEASVLDLPHIEHLELYNCWVTPNILAKFIHKLRRNNLKHLSLKYVSLTVKPELTSNLKSIVNHIPPASIESSQVTIAEPNVVYEPLQAGTGVRPYSWPYIIDALTPGKLLNWQPGIEPFNVFQKKRHPYPQFESWSFFSCGYCKISETWDQREISAPPGYVFPRGVRRMASKRGNFSGRMMLCHDKLMGYIECYRNPDEVSLMRDVWKLMPGWNGEPGPDPDTFEYLPPGQGAVEDDKLPGGTGRFSGIITAVDKDPEYDVSIISS